MIVIPDQFPFLPPGIIDYTNVEKPKVVNLKLIEDWVPTTTLK